MSRQESQGPQEVETHLVPTSVVLPWQLAWLSLQDPCASQAGEADTAVWNFLRLPQNLVFSCDHTEVVPWALNGGLPQGSNQQQIV